MYEYPSSPSLVLHLGELDDKPKEHFEKTKKEVSHKNTLAKWVHQHKIAERKNKADDGKGSGTRISKVLKRSKTEFHPFVTRKYKSLRNKITCP